MWYWYQNRHTQQWNRIKNPEINPDTFGQLIFDKRGKKIKWEKDSLFSKYCWETWTAECKSMKPEDTLTLCTKINSKWLKHLNIRQETIKLLEEEHRQNILWHQPYKCFLRSASQGNRNKSKNKPIGPKQTDMLLHSKGNHTHKKNPKRQPMEWEKIVSNDATDKGLISKIYKQLLQLNSKKSQQLNGKTGKRPD